LARWQCTGREGLSGCPTKTFSDLGYVEGKDAMFLHRYRDNQLDRYRELATDLIDNKVDVIIAMTHTGVLALKQATSTTPIVFVTVVDPVGAGLAQAGAGPSSNRARGADGG